MTREYDKGEIKNFKCPNCKINLVDMTVYGDFEDSWVNENHEFLQRRLSCGCESINWEVTYKLIPTKIEEIEED